LASARDRPLLAGAADVTSKLAALLVERASAYAECSGEVETEGLDVDEIAARVLEIVREAAVTVPLGERTYRVEIGRGIADRIGARLVGAGVAGQVVVVGDSNVEEPWARRARERVADAGLVPVPVTLPPGEAHKTLASVERIWDAALEAGVDRRAAVLAVGGGVVGDLAGFAASTLLRGVALAQLPTSLLAMVDSSVGGKTGFDRAQGKNLVGSFHQPRVVLCDVDVLSTLPREERIAGLAEVLKSAWIDGEEAVAALERDAEALVLGDPDATMRAVRSAVSLKARIVGEDEREQGPRALLNLGHTLGHAMESASGYAMRHGDAVARGMVAAMRLSRALSSASAEDEARLVGLLARLELPSDPEAFLDERALAFVGADKKRAGASVRFVVPGAPGAVGLRMLPIDTVRELASRR
ncbi:MAG: 3-dehydroquinate synthase, partial [Myxococcota bacterium]|nr:3-dehydroquinate synthase [Myxococcota bacterium]